MSSEIAPADASYAPAEEEEDEEERPKVPIVYALPVEEQGPSLLDEEREKHRRRAAKFGTKYVEPSRSRRGDVELVLEAKKERLAREGFATGIDLFTEEEAQKRAARAARFNIQEPQALEYRPDEEALAKARRAKKFNVQFDATEGAMMDMDLFESRAEAPAHVERRHDAIYLYGVDTMSTGDCLSYFKEYGPTFVEWINDSSCVVTFRDKYSAARAMAGVGKPLPSEEQPDAAAPDAPDAEGAELQSGAPPAARQPLDPSLPANMPFLWHQGRDFLKQGVAIHLVYRMAVVTDRKDASQPRKTRELWKTQRDQQQQGAQRGRKSRRTQLDQGAGGGGRVDGDGDVDMHGGDEGPSGGGDDDVDMERRRGRRGGRRRKQRNADGTYSVMDVDEDGGGGGGREEGGGEGGHGQPPHHEEEHHHEQESFDPLVGRMGAGQGGRRRHVKARRSGAHAQGPDGDGDGGGGGGGGGDAGGDGGAQHHLESAPPPE